MALVYRLIDLRIDLGHHTMRQTTDFKLEQAFLLMLFSVIGIIVPILFARRVVYGKTRNRASFNSLAQHSKLRATSHAHDIDNREFSCQERTSGEKGTNLSLLKDGGNQREWIAIVLSGGNAFSGGVMLTTGLVHILADALEISVSTNETKHLKDGILPPLVLCVVGILIPFTLEKSGLAWWLLKNRQWCTHHYVNMHDDHTIDETEIPVECSTLKSNGLYDTNERKEFGDSSDKTAHVVTKISEELQCASKCVIPGIASTKIQSRIDMYRSAGSTRSLEHAPLIYRSKCTRSDKEDGSCRSDSLFPSKETNLFTRPDESEKICHHHPEKHSHMKYATSLMFVVLSVHSSIVGLTIGTTSSVSSRMDQPAFMAFCFA